MTAAQPDIKLRGINKRVLSMKESTGLNQQLRWLGYEVHAPDMSMYTLGGGVHCLCQALRRDAA